MSGILRNEEYFPPFQKLPLDNTYVNCDKNTKEFPKKPWCILTEIVDAGQLGFCTPRVTVKDKCGDLFRVFFYHKNPNSQLFVKIIKDGKSLIRKSKWSGLEVGKTLCVRFAKQHNFMSGDHGIRIENLKFVKLVNAPLINLLNLSDAFCESRAPYVCWKCASECKLRCVRCNIAYYCNKSCQTADWVNHKQSCHLLQDYMDLVDINVPNSVEPETMGFKQDFVESPETNDPDILARVTMQ